MNPSATPGWGVGGSGFALELEGLVADLAGLPLGGELAAPFDEPWVRAPPQPLPPLQGGLARLDEGDLTVFFPPQAGRWYLTGPLLRLQRWDVVDSALEEAEDENPLDWNDDGDRNGPKTPGVGPGADAPRPRAP